MFILFINKLFFSVILVEEVGFNGEKISENSSKSKD